MSRLVSKIFSKVFGSRNKRIVKKLSRVVSTINSLEPEMQKLTDQELQAKTEEFKSRYQSGETLDQLLPEAFAVVREASVRALSMRHFDVQLIGGMVLHQGKVAEMCTGEGKTLVSTLPAYLNALTGEGVHIITVNDYLATRDAAWMEPVYKKLGMTVGVNIAQMSHEEKQRAYAADITYGTNNEFGFDYLRDNMTFSQEEKVQKELHYAVIDEVDSILIDEARTPLIISGAAEDSSDLYSKINEIVPSLTRQADKESEGDYFVEEKDKQVHLSEQGHQNAEELLRKAGLLEEGESLYDASNIIYMHHLNAALRAHAIFTINVDYIVKNGEIIIVDEHTGRTMPGRRWSDGLHQAIEAKEKVDIQNENQTLASITFQNYFRMYDKLSGMTGTADTEAYELHEIYNLEVVVIPTNKPVARIDHVDQVYMTAEEKFDAIMAEIKTVTGNGAPVLVGTASIEVSEYLSNLLTKNKIKHNVLNAKFHKKEADIIAEAGRPGYVTIATNMAGRGTDIVLGGNVERELELLDSPTDEAIEQHKADWQQRHDQVLKAGGLHVIGTERHESRRIDNQLRGRSGRQGDAGSSKFYLSLEDNLLRIFAADRIKSLMSRMGVEKGTALESGLLSRCIENAQRKVEAHNFDIRKQLLEYDDVANDQRKVIYQQRQQLMKADDISENITNMRSSVIDSVVSKYLPEQTTEEQWEIAELQSVLENDFGIKLHLQQWLDEDSAVDREQLLERIQQAFETHLANKEEQVSTEAMRSFEKSVLMQTLDSHWKEHLASMDYLRQGIHLRGYAQKNPKQEYKKEAFELFTNLLENIKYEVVSILGSFIIQAPEQEEKPKQVNQYQNVNYSISFQNDDEAMPRQPSVDDLIEDAETVSGSEGKLSK